MIALDTNVLVALADHRDPLRKRATSDLQRLGGKPMSASSAVLTEACHLLLHDALRARLAALLTELEVQPAEPDSTSTWSETFAWLARYAEHEPDWADASLAVASGRNRRLRVWTYDREFATTWRRPDGSKIPLAVSLD